MKINLIILILLLFTFTTSLAQIRPDEIRKPNLKDKIERIIAEENNKLNSLIFKTEVWISDKHSNQYDFDYGIIINKNQILQKSSNWDKANLHLLIRLILSHEKMHAKYYSRFDEQWKRKYANAVSVEQLLMDEVEADIVAGYYAFEFNNFEEIEFVLKILKEANEKGPEGTPELSEKELDFGKKIKKEEVDAFKLFFEIGENQTRGSRYPNSNQRMTALEIGIKVASIHNYQKYLNTKKSTLTSLNIELLEIIIDKSKSDIEYNNVHVNNELDYFYYSYIRSISRKITHVINRFSDYVLFKLLSGKEPDENGYAKFQSSITNNNKIDSIRVDYSVIISGRSMEDDDDSYPHYSILTATQSSIVLAPLQTKVVTDSLFDTTEFIKDATNFKALFPGKLGSLYFTELINQRNSVNYFKESKIEITGCDNCKPDLDDLLKNLFRIQNDFRIDDLEDYKAGIGFQDIDTDYISYSLFLRKRPYELLIYPDGKKSILKTIIYKNEDMELVKEFIKSIKNKLEQQKNTNHKIIVDAETYAVLLTNDSNVNLGAFEIIKDRLSNDYQIALSLYK